MGRVTAPDTRFALGLHRLLAADRDRSFAWSPYSVASALGVVGAGARGATRDELAAVLGDLDELGAGAGRRGRVPGRRGGDPRRGQHAVGGPDPAGGRRVPGRGQGLAGRRGPRRRLPRQPGRVPAGDQRRRRAQHPRADQRPHPGRHGRPGHQGGRRQRALPAGGVGEAVREGGDPAAAVPDAGRAGGRADDAGDPLSCRTRPAAGGRWCRCRPGPGWWRTCCCRTATGCRSSTRARCRACSTRPGRGRWRSSCRG